MRKVLVTGGTGFIGNHVCHELQRRDIDFLVLSNIPMPFFMPEKIQMVSLSDRKGLIDVIGRYQPDAIIHLAAIALVTHEDSSEIYQVNVCGSENLLEAARAACAPGTPVVLISTAGVYGNQNHEFLSENLPFNPANHYSYSKMVMEMLSRNYEDYLDIRIVRPFNVIGSGQKETFFIPKLVNCFANRQPEIQLGNLKSIRDYIDIDFCAFALVELLCREKVKFNILNLCSGIPYSGTDIIEILTELTGFKPEININSSFVRSNEVWRMVGSNSRLAEFLGNRYKVKTVHNILQEMLVKTSS